MYELVDTPERCATKSVPFYATSSYVRLCDAVNAPAPTAKKGTTKSRPVQKAAGSTTRRASATKSRTSKKQKKSEAKKPVSKRKRKRKAKEQVSSNASDDSEDDLALSALLKKHQTEAKKK